jgi:DNA end-binding protein Ku
MSRVSLMSGTRGTTCPSACSTRATASPIRFERVNADTGEEVPWKDVVKAFEYDKGSYVVIEQEDIASAAPETHESVEIEAFVDADAIEVRYLREALRAGAGQEGREGLRPAARDLAQGGQGRRGARGDPHPRIPGSAVMPQGDALVLMMMRYPQELVDPSDYKLPAGQGRDYRVSARELEMATQLVDSMATRWQPDDYHDEFRERLSEIIRKRIKSEGRDHAGARRGRRVRRGGAHQRGRLRLACCRRAWATRVARRPRPGRPRPRRRRRALDLARAQAPARGSPGAGDGDVAAGGEHVDLADGVLRQAARIAGQRADDVAGAQLVGAAGVDAQGGHRRLRHGCAACRSSGTMRS